MRRPDTPSLERRGMLLIASSELWERFAFFGVQSLVFLFLSNRAAQPGGLHGIWGGLALERFLSSILPITQPGQFASMVFGLYAGLLYIGVVLGGIATDRGFGVRRAVVIGGVFSVAGYALMTFEPAFLAGMGLVVIGSSGFKGNISNEFALRAPSAGPQRDEAFRFLYIAMHVGMLATPLVCGTLSQVGGWRWGFASAAIGMMVSLLIYLAVPPISSPLHKPSPPSPPGAVWTRSRIAGFAVVLPLFAVAFVASQQIYNAYVGWAQASVKLSVGGLPMPTTWLLAVDTALELTMLAASVLFWRAWRRWRPEPDSLTKIGLAGLPITLALGCLALVRQSHGPVTVALLFGFHALNGMGYATMLPAAFAFLTRCAPPGARSTLVGLFYLQFAIAAIIAGLIGRLIDVIGGPAFWTLHAAIAAGAGVILLLVRRWVSAQLAPHAPRLSRPMADQPIEPAAPLYAHS